MNRALLLKTLRDARWLIVSLTIGAIAFEVLYVTAITSFLTEIVQIWKQIGVVRNIVQVMVGIDLSRDVSSTSLVAMGFVHPLMLTITWVFLITTGTRVIAGEIDRGTADLLMSLPISRAATYVSVSLAWVIGSVPIAIAPWCGMMIAGQTAKLNEPLHGGALFLPVGNLIALSLAVGGVTMLASAICTRRGRAVAIAIAVVFVSFLISFLEAIWPFAKHFGALGLLHYYRPVDVVGDAAFPVRSVLVLVGVGAVCWGLGFWRFCRRDVPAA